jgi:hypothetical protein
VLHSNLKPFEGDQVYDKNGQVKRVGGGPAKDYSSEVENEVKTTKASVDKLK